MNAPQSEIDLATPIVTRLAASRAAGWDSCRRRADAATLRLISLALLGTGTASGQVFHYDLGDDFSHTNNPSGPWSYEAAGVPIACPLVVPGGVRSGWGCYSNQDVSVTKFTAAPEPGWHDAQNGDVVIHVASSCCNFPSPVAIEWTAPIPGFLTVRGRAWDASFASDRDGGWLLSLGAQSLASRGGVRGLFRSDAPAALGNNLAPGMSLTELPVSVGDRLVFTTSRSGSSVFGHFMGVELDLELRCTVVAAALPARTICPGGTAVFQAESIGPLATAFEWFVSFGGELFVPVLEGANPGFAALGANNALLHVTPDADYSGPALAFRCRLSNICGEAVAGPAALRITRADINCDGSVGLTDLAILLTAFGSCAGDPAFNAAADVNANSCVDLPDLAVLLANFGL
jgi:hypothetical protein